MICSRCLRSSRLSTQIPKRTLSTTAPLSNTPTPRSSPPAATSSGLAQPFSNPLSLRPATASTPKSKAVLPESICPAGNTLKGLNYIKGKEDPIAKAEEEYPEWLWRCLDARTVEAGEEGGAGDEFSKSKKSRRLAAKRQRKLEEQLLLSGNTEALAPKIPITAQSIDLPANEEGTLKGALEAVARREEVTEALRRQRRKGIKERNFLGSV